MAHFTKQCKTEILMYFIKNSKVSISLKTDFLALIIKKSKFLLYLIKMEILGHLI